MTKEEYIGARTKLATDYFAKCEALKQQYARENAQNAIFEGDLITDGKNYLIVKSIRFTDDNNEPELIYYGEKVKKDGSKLKRAQTISIKDTNAQKI